MKSHQSVARTIVACVVLHNLTIDFEDDVVEIDGFDPHFNWHRHANNLGAAVGMDHNGDMIDDEAALQQQRFNIERMHSLEAGQNLRTLVKNYLWFEVGNNY